MAAGKLDLFSSFILALAYDQFALTFHRCHHEKLHSTLNFSLSLSLSFFRPSVRRHRRPRAWKYTVAFIKSTQHEFSVLLFQRDILQYQNIISIIIPIFF
jgi:hypothetical protein